MSTTSIDILQFGEENKSFFVSLKFKSVDVSSIHSMGQLFCTFWADLRKITHMINDEEEKKEKNRKIEIQRERRKDALLVKV